MQNSDLWTRKTSFYGSQTSPVALWMQNSVISIRPTSLYVSQPSSVFLLMQYRAFWTRISSLYRSQTSSVVLSTHNCELNTEWNDNIGTSPHLWLCACKTATLGLELQVSEGQRHHLWLFHAKQRLQDQSNKSLWVPVLTCRFVHVQQRA